MELQQVAIPLVIAAIVSALSTPLVSRLATALGVIDRPNERKVNRRTGMPLLGGVAIAMGCAVGVASALLLMEEDAAVARRLQGFLAGGVLVLLIGVFDDRWSLSAWPKLAVQIVAAGVAIDHGFLVEYFRDPFTGASFDLPFWFGCVLTTLWIVGVSNAMNLIDGLDGLSAGVGVIIATTLTLICFQADQFSGVLLGLIMVGAVVGFLPFNFPPAKIFLGDAGALFIGFGLALVSIEGYLGGYRKASLMAFLVPLLALAVPLLDTLLSILRRLRAGQPVMSADRMHMHHRLLEVEGSERAAVLSLYFLTACFCVIAVSFTRLQGYAALAFLVAVVILTVRLLRNMGVYSAEPLPGTEARDTAAEKAAGKEGS